MTEYINTAMSAAITEAWKRQILTYPNPTVGAVIAKSGIFFGASAHLMVGEAHAEVNAFKSAFILLSSNDEAKKELNKITDSIKIHNFLSAHHNGIFKDCELFVTLEPCAHFGKTPPCANLSAKLGIKKVYIGSLDPNKKASGGIEVLKNAGVEVQVGVMAKECDDLLLPFKKWLNGRFVFFKLATTLNGGTLGNITGDLAKDEVHKLRAMVDLLITGGETVRIDRPILDARRVNGRAPNLAIYSKCDNFDKTIPCFSVVNRNVTITKDLAQSMDSKRLVMIEGGINLLKATFEFYDAVLLLQNGSFNRDAVAFEQNLRIVNSRQIGNDNALWLYKNFS